MGATGGHVTGRDQLISVHSLLALNLAILPLPPRSEAAGDFCGPSACVSLIQEDCPNDWVCLKPERVPEHHTGTALGNKGWA